MAVSYDIETASNYADIIIHGMSTLGANNISLRIFLNNSFVEWVEDIDTTWLLDYTYTYGGLDPDTSYSFEIEFWDYRTVVDSISGRFTTESGGGGGDEPYFDAWAESNTNIYVNAYDLRYVDYDRVYYEIDSGSYSDSYTGLGSHTFENVPNGEYTVRAYYIYRNSYYQIYTEQGYSYITVSIGGGGGGSWQLYEERAGTVSSSFDFPYNNGFEGMTLYRMSITFSQNVTVTFSTSGSADTIGWLSEYNQTGWDDTTGRPTDYVAYDDDSGSGSNFEFSYTCTAGYVYYLWYRTYGEGGYVGSTITLSVNLGAPAQQWSYDGVSGYSSLSSEVQKSISLSSMVGQYFGVSFRDAGTATISAPSGANIDLFVTDANYGFDTSDGYPFDYGGGKASSSLSHNINVTAGTTYYVWVKGATSSIYGNVTITITPYSAPTGWEEVYVGDVNVTTTDRSFNRSCATMKVYRYNVRYSTGGTVRIYSTGATSSSDVIAYWGTSNNGINTSTGAPTSYSNVWDDDGSDRNFNSGEITVAANTTYYLWVRCYRDDTTAQITIYFTAPAADTGGVWIYTSSGWRKATPYIYTSSGWRKATPYVYTSSGWRKCT